MYTKTYMKQMLELCDKNCKVATVKYLNEKDKQILWNYYKETEIFLKTQIEFTEY